MVSSAISHQKHTGNTGELEVLPSPNVLPWKIQGCQNSQEPITISELARVYRLPNLEALTHYFFTKNVFNSAPQPISDADRLLTYPVLYYNTLRLSVISLDKKAYITHFARCTGLSLFRNRESRADWIWVRRRARLPNEQPGGLNGRIPAKLNALFKLRGPEGIYRLVYITLTKCIGSPIPTGEEGMVRVRSRDNENSDAVVKISDIEA